MATVRSAKLLWLLTVLQQTLALSAHSPRDLEAFPAYNVVLSDHAVLNETALELLAKPASVSSQDARTVEVPEQRELDLSEELTIHPHIPDRDCRSTSLSKHCGDTCCAHRAAKLSSARCLSWRRSAEPRMLRLKRTHLSKRPNATRDSPTDLHYSNRCGTAACTCDKGGLLTASGALGITGETRPGSLS